MKQETKSMKVADEKRKIKKKNSVTEWNINHTAPNYLSFSAETTVRTPSETVNLISQPAKPKPYTLSESF